MITYLKGVVQEIGDLYVILDINNVGFFVNTSNITNYKPKDFAELLGVSVKIL